MKRQCELLLDLDQNEIEDILENGHDWAQDHISEAKNNMDQVFDFLMNETNTDYNEDGKYIYQYAVNAGRTAVGSSSSGKGS